MNCRSQAGFTLVECAIAVAVAGIAICGLISAMNGFARFAGHQASPAHDAAAQLADQTLRIAEDAWKYGSPGAAPAGTASVSVPLARPGAAATLMPMNVTTSVTNATASSAHIDVTVRYTPDPNRPGDRGAAGISADIDVAAPAPGARITESGLVPQPAGAP